MANLIDPTLVPVVDDAKAVRFDTPIGSFLFVSATGRVPTSGWSDVALSPHYYAAPPADGIWDFDFIADAPSGLVLPIELPVSASVADGAPNWMKGIRVRAGKNEKLVTNFLSLTQEKVADDLAFQASGFTENFSSRAIISQEIAVYDDSFQPIGFCSGFPPKVKMKKLRHRLILTIEGPDERKIRRCINEAIAAGLLAAIIAVFVTGGAALSAAIGALKSYLVACLGSGFEVRIDRRSHWIEWCT